MNLDTLALLARGRVEWQRQQANERMRSVPYPNEAKGIRLDFDGARWTPVHEVQALIWLCRQTEGSILEIGCNEGRTTRELALAYPARSVVGVDYSGLDDTLCPEQKGEKPAQSAIGRHAAMLPNVKILNQKSEDLRLADLPDRTGFIFIDGDHTYRGVKDDSELALRILKRNLLGNPPLGCVIAWHDCYEDAPVWVGVRTYLEREFLSHYPVQHIEGTWLAYSDLQL